MGDQYSLNTPLGKLNIVCSNKGVTKIKFLKVGDVDSKTEDEVLSSKSNQHLKSAIEWFKIYFENPSEIKNTEAPQMDLDAHRRKEFICKVWQVLREQVGPGETISYGELAKLCGSPKAARAVGQAMRTNPFTILVPCHRVINASGELGNYSGGIDKKKWLLNHEGKDF